MNIEKTVIITGGTGNVGRYIVDKFAREGYKVYLPVRSLKKFMDIFDSSIDDDKEFSLRKIYAFECDVLNEKEVDEFVNSVAAQEKGKIDLLINTVGGFHDYQRVGEIDYEFLIKEFAINFNTTFYFTKRCLSYMIKNKLGQIISISSLAGLNPMEGRFPYSVSKAAVINLMQNINLEYKKDNISAYSIVPGTIDTPTNRKWGSEEDIKTWVKPEHIADVIYDITNDKYKDNFIIKV